ncbi:Transcription elongation factor spt5 [Labeo rohita]|uniref:Transcription elongation factor spt5 n=1 Tax=Labeo rohita TaxID=84645 RepID=A0ABQ8M9C0_LABRO|nr:Transcription elongation factor spt5 [Labeo rohita]
MLPSGVTELRIALEPEPDCVRTVCLSCHEHTGRFSVCNAPGTRSTYLVCVASIHHPRFSQTVINSHPAFFSHIPPSSSVTLAPQPCLRWFLSVPQLILCLPYVEWICLRASSLQLHLGVRIPSPPPAFKSRTPPWSSLAPPWLLAHLSPPWPVIPLASPASLVLPAPPWSVINNPLPRGSTPLALSFHSIPLALSGSSFPPALPWSSVARSSSPPWSSGTRVSSWLSVCST